MKSLDGSFFESESVGWRWRYTDPHDGSEKRADQLFLTLLDCINDAVKHGYSIEPTPKPKSAR